LLRAVTIFALCSQAGAWSQQAKLPPGQESVSKVTLRGRITAKGNPLAAATVTITNPVFGASRTASTDASASWSFPASRRGVYLVRVEKEGYSPFARQQSVLSADQELD
jgi:hypothetical protein